ncbi:MAG TPA: transglycosylase SLT domain-containing protein [Burkholderiaceae bacterium]|nr:transglycosylase SLT domain-containing protein [Burkholderiaceae bacterium]
MIRRFWMAAGLALTMTLAGCMSQAVRDSVTAPTLSPQDRPSLKDRMSGALNLRKDPPALQWAGQDGADAWTQATIEALEEEGITLLSAVPADIMQYCPGYAAQSRENRAAFWAGFLSAVARHESGWNPAASKDGGRRLGLMQISQDDSRANGCRGGLLDAGDNMHCAVRILARHVARDSTIDGGSEAGDRPRGVANVWSSLRSGSRRADIATWTRRQSYCR